MQARIIQLVNDNYRQIWDFEFITEVGDRATLLLDGYHVETKQPNKRKWTKGAYYSRIHDRESTLKRNEVELPEYIIQQAKELIKERIQNLPIKDSYY